MTTTMRRRSKPKKMLDRECYNWRKAKPKKDFKTVSAANAFLKNTNQTRFKTAYPCRQCGGIHVGRK